MAYLRTCLLELRRQQSGGIAADVAFLAGHISAQQAANQFKFKQTHLLDHGKEAAEAFAPATLHSGKERTDHD